MVEVKELLEFLRKERQETLRSCLHPPEKRMKLFNKKCKEQGEVCIVCSTMFSTKPDSSHTLKENKL